MKLSEDPAFRPIADTDRPPFFAHAETATGSRLVVDVYSHTPEARTLAGLITESDFTYPDLMVGVGREFSPYVEVFVPVDTPQPWECSNCRAENSTKDAACVHCGTKNPTP